MSSTYAMCIDFSSVLQLLLTGRTQRHVTFLPVRYAPAYYTVFQKTCDHILDDKLN